jgi:hypothetical protein
MSSKRELTVEDPERQSKSRVLDNRTGNGQAMPANLEEMGEFEDAWEDELESDSGEDIIDGEAEHDTIYEEEEKNGERNNGNHNINDLI